MECDCSSIIIRRTEEQVSLLQKQQQGLNTKLQIRRHPKSVLTSPETRIGHGKSAKSDVMESRRKVLETPKAPQTA